MLCRRNRGLLRAGALVAAVLMSGCETDPDPRAGAFIDGVTNLSTGGYRAYVKERRDEAKETQDQAEILEARARSIEAERAALDREVQQASDELAGLQERLRELQNDLAAKQRLSAAQRRKLGEADRKAKRARAHVSTLRSGAPLSVEAQRRGVADLKALIGSVGAMVKELSR